MKIAVIGSGISGLTAAYYLSQQHDVTVYEANDYIGGHTATIDVETEDETLAIDTGFIVYNDKTYPNFIRLLKELNVEGKPTEMSFSVRNDSCDLEYNGHTLATLFAQKRNLLNPVFYRFLYEITKFNYLAKKQYRQSNELTIGKTLGEFLGEYKFSDYFCHNYILPMGAAIWSSTVADMRQIPLFFFLRFFSNHGLLDLVNRPQWFVVNGGSKSYIGPLTQRFKDSIYLKTPVTGIKRNSHGVEVETAQQTAVYDHVILACHSDQALKMINDPSDDEQDVLSGIKYQANQVTLHRDIRLLPERKRAWAAWNYWISESQTDNSFGKPTLTYNMNILQGLNSEQTYCVSLNSDGDIDPKSVIRRFVYHHPVFTPETIKAQARKHDIDGRFRTWFCGAYWYNGFHEDGVRSALDVVRQIKQMAASELHSPKEA
ncbi:NAD(P)/FAD-dependent oxidoreductase [Vibrio salinus]|uniref:NAD(P)/FAD-dependent oxidoreductase n=1 Tax=Vibrio salinus TaxID=2899784 RepID=UPI001E49D0A9|nr:FAD-dependent oxidoreductase [Vibrio salinus]MCE0496239.1 FAD-dependent oxidoreductase [Vibrio salinus]